MSERPLLLYCQDILDSGSAILSYVQGERHNQHRARMINPLAFLSVHEICIMSPDFNHRQPLINSGKKMRFCIGIYSLLSTLLTVV